MTKPPAGATYDVVIVGAGIVGSILALQLCRAGKRVAILEAGIDTTDQRGAYVATFQTATSKTPESPYPMDNVMARRPTTDMDCSYIEPYGKNDPRRDASLPPCDNTHNPPYTGYWLQTGKQPFASTYERQMGGTTWHWLGLTPRMLPNDFDIRTRYGVGVDWPISYADLEPWYRAAEEQIVIAGDVAQQNFCGLWYEKGYRYQMAEVPPTYSDKQIQAGLTGLRLFGQEVHLTSTPTARNTQAHGGRRACMGNTSCIPICPIRAKFDATVPLAEAMQHGAQLFCQTVVDQVLVDPSSGAVSGVHYKWYADPSDAKSAVEEGEVNATVYVIAAHAVEGPKLLLNSRTGAMPNGVANRSDQVGRNLMDHPFALAWGLFPTPLYPMRGPRVVSQIHTLRDGPFRSTRPAFTVDIGNEGWNWVNDEPNGSVNDFVTQGLIGPALRSALNNIGVRALRFGYMIEQVPNPANRVTLSTENDALGIPRPNIVYDLDDYTKAGFVAARQATTAMFQKLGVQDKTSILYAQPGCPTTFKVDSTWYQFFGSGHIVGTHRMGSDPTQSVIDENCRSHDHPNLFLCGPGSMPTIGTSNPTLTAVALTLKAAPTIIAAATQA